MFNCLYTILLCNFGIAFSHTICVTVKYFGKLLLKLFGIFLWNQLNLFKKTKQNKTKQNKKLK